jgi:hypothetical protein
MKKPGRQLWQPGFFIGNVFYGSFFGRQFQPQRLYFAERGTADIRYFLIWQGWKFQD